VTTFATPDLDIRTETKQGQSNQDVAHFVDQRASSGQDIATAIILGETVTALCGYTWIPFRPPEGRPVCMPCIEALEAIHRHTDGK
jgi:hypothetical protein